jgi:hypothetical protein
VLVQASAAQSKTGANVKPVLIRVLIRVVIGLGFPSALLKGADYRISKAA